MSLTANSTVGAWLDDALGGPIFASFIQQGGGSVDSLAPARGLPLVKLVELSGGKFPAEAVDALVGEYAKVAPADAAEPDAPAAAAAPAGFTEVITPGRFVNQTVIVTGAASGIGRAVASRVAREGGRVIAADVSTEGLASLVEQLSPLLPTGAELVTVAGDISDDADVAKIVAACDGRVDALANNAGIMDDMSAVHEVSDDIWDRVFRVNVTGTMKLSRAVLPLMLAAKNGRIVNVTSEAGLRGSAAGAAYTASKHAVVGLTKSMAVMYSGSGVRVNAVAPGGVATGIQVPPGSEFGQGRIMSFMGNMPGIATAEELAAAITFLLSADSSNINGALLASDGGWSAV